MSLQINVCYTVEMRKAYQITCSMSGITATMIGQHATIQTVLVDRFRAFHAPTHRLIYKHYIDTKKQTITRINYLSQI